MDTRLLFQDVAGFATPMLAVFAVDIAIGKDAEPLPALLTTSDAVTDAAARVMASGEFKAALGETLLLHAPGGLKAERLLLVGLGKAKSLQSMRFAKGVAPQYGQLSRAVCGRRRLRFRKTMPCPTSTWMSFLAC